MAASNTLSTSFLKQVFLHDWWLIKSGCRLGIGGFTSKGGQAIRIFNSAAIAKRHDAVNLQTVDGIGITICGIINTSRSLQNGFPYEVCGHFLVGFPRYWEQYADMAAFFGRESVKESSDGLSGSGSLPVYLDDVSVTMAHDLFMSSSGFRESSDLINNIFDEMLEKYGGDGNKTSSERVVFVDSKACGSPNDHKRARTKQNRSNCPEKISGNLRTADHTVCGSSCDDKTGKNLKRNSPSDCLNERRDDESIMVVGLAAYGSPLLARQKKKGDTTLRTPEFIGSVHESSGFSSRRVTRSMTNSKSSRK